MITKNANKLMDKVKHPVKNKMRILLLDITANTKNTIIDAGSAHMNVSHNNSLSVKSNVKMTNTKIASNQTEDTIKKENFTR